MFFRVYWLISKYKPQQSASVQDDADGNADGRMDEGQPILHQEIRDDQKRRGMVRLVVAEIRHALAYGVKRQILKQRPSK